MNTDTCSNALNYGAINKGAALVCEGLVESALMHATSLGNLTLDIRSYPNEKFGPCKGIACLRGDEEAATCVNDDGYGLSTAIFSRDTARAHKVAADIQFGICHINAHAVHDAARMPFCGVESSGIGRFGCNAGIAEATLTCARSSS